MSIQLPLGGHSFSVDAIPAEAVADDRQVEFRVITPRTLLVPREQFDDAGCEAYLRVAGMPPLAGETAIASDTAEQTVAVMAIDSDCLAAIRGRFGARAVFTTPLLDIQKYASPTVWLHRIDDILYVKVYNTTLRLAEAVTVTSDADTVMLMHDLDAVFGFGGYAIRCHGEQASSMRKLLSKYYSDVRCE
ncbi:MAG: hypothetical protein K2J51_04440 [Alistipes sp.]|nr:hypothetical protein [Alistipes sp.]